MKITRLNTTKLAHYIEIGRKDMDWYLHTQNMFIELFGEDRLELVCNLFAATSINTSLKSNVTLFRKALYEITHDLPVGKYLPNIQQQLFRVRSGQELSGRKIRSFSKALSGHKSAVVVDVWLTRAFKIDRKYFRNDPDHKKGGTIRNGGVPDRDYTRIERWVRRYARRNGYEARQVSAMIWSGVRITSGGSKQTRYHDFLRSKLNNLFNVI